jgi:hypothetical protein
VLKRVEIIVEHDHLVVGIELAGNLSGAVRSYGWGIGHSANSRNNGSHKAEARKYLNKMKHPEFKNILTVGWGWSAQPAPFVVGL